MKQTLFSLLIFSFLQIAAQGPYSPPYSTDFNNYSTEAEFLTDWSYQNNLPTDQAGVWGFDNTAYFGYNSSNCPFYFTASTSDGDDWLFSPGFNLTQGTTYSLSFLYAGALNGYVEKMKVYAGNDDTSTAMTQLLQDFNAITSSTFQTSTVLFSVPTSGVYHFGFWAQSASGNFGILIDNFALNVQTAIMPCDISEIQVYPNPCNGMLHLSTNDKSHVALFSSCGQLLYEESVTETVDLSGFENGLYFIRIDDRKAIPLEIQNP